MSTTTSGDQARAWTERVRAGTFSPAVAGTREVRVFGQAGDAPVAELRRVAPVPVAVCGCSGRPVYCFASS